MSSPKDKPNANRAHGETLNEILRLEAELLAAERQACRNLADHLRHAIDGLPLESRLSRVFARRIREFELMGTGAATTPSPDGWLDMALGNMQREMRDVLPEDKDEED